MCKSSSDCSSHNHDVEGGCGCESRQDKFIDAAMLMLIAKDSGHGYDLIERLKRYGFESVDPTKVYRRLRRLESECLLKSQWQTENTGPARRAYTITQEGTDFLLTWQPTIQKTLEVYAVFLEDLKAVKSSK